MVCCREVPVHAQRSGGGVHAGDTRGRQGRVEREQRATSCMLPRTWCEMCTPFLPLPLSSSFQAIFFPPPPSPPPAFPQIRRRLLAELSDAVYNAVQSFHSDSAVRCARRRGEVDAGQRAVASSWVCLPPQVVGRAGESTLLKAALCPCRSPLHPALPLRPPSLQLCRLPQPSARPAHPAPARRAAAGHAEDDCHDSPVGLGLLLRARGMVELLASVSHRPATHPRLPTHPPHSAMPCLQRRKFVPPPLPQHPDGSGGAAFRRVAAQLCCV